MPHYVLIEVSDEAARDFVKHYVGDGHPDFRAVAVWKKPTIWCDNSDGHRKRKTQSGWTRGRKWGWWVCAICGKPSRAWVEGSLWRFDSVFGFNLLPDSIIGKRPRAHMGRSPEEWTWLDETQVPTVSS